MSLVFYSTNHQAREVDLATALLQGQAEDRGLYMPRPMPSFPAGFLVQARSLSYPELAASILEPFAEGVFSRKELDDICGDAYTFPVPLEKVTAGRYVMRLDQGPTASFKDFAARFMGRAIGRLVRRRGQELLILTATSGDTGSAVAHAFHNVEGIRVLVLFPRDEVSERQRKQMTTLGGNIETISVLGKFDDCQALVKRAFADPDLAGLNLSSANSINIGRLLPQSVYYVHAATQLADAAGGEKVVFSVPSGNFGDMMGGLIAWRMGLPVAKFVLATNANDEVPRFLASGRYEKIEPSHECVSNAMNVGHPSNLARVVDLYGGRMDEKGAILQAPDMEALRRDLFAISISDDLTRSTIAEVHRQYGVVLEPHGAVGWAGLQAYFRQVADKQVTAISLETAHPAKFPDEVRALIGIEPALPRALEGLEALKETFGELPSDYAEFKRHLIQEYPVMKSIIIIGDGMSDLPVDSLGGKTPLMASHKPAIDRVARLGRMGQLQSIPEGMESGSDVATLSVLGYDPRKLMNGRAVLEAASMGVDLADDDVALRLNLICTEHGRIKNHSAGHITTEEAAAIIQTLDAELGNRQGERPVSLHLGVSYRHLLVLHGAWATPELRCAPPHDHVGEAIEDLMPRATAPSGAAAQARFWELYERALPILEQHPVNRARIAAGKDPANAIWAWSPGRRPDMPTLQQRFGVRGAVISAVDLVLGLGRYAGMDLIRVPGATGLHDTNYEGKAEACLDALADYDLVFVHVEATDEASHACDVDLKVRCIEYLDDRLVRIILEGLQTRGIKAAVAVLPDHPTHVGSGKHGKEAVPVAILRPGETPDGAECYDERQAERGALGLMQGDAFIRTLLAV